MKHLLCLLIFLFVCILSIGQQSTLKTDVLVIGGGTGGTVAAIQAARMGVKTILVEPTGMLGGMLTTGGVSCTHGNDQLPSGIWEEFRQALYNHYGQERLNSGWVSNTSFEPHVGDSIFKSWAAKEPHLQVLFGRRFTDVLKEKNNVKGAIVYDMYGKSIRIVAGVVIDATELGDVLAKAGAGYELGMDDPLLSGEKEAKEKNNIIQDLTWAAILKDYGANADKTIAKPKNYNAKNYHCCSTDAPCADKPWNGDKFKMLNYGKLPRSPGAQHDKYMLNWPIHGNDFYLNVVEKNHEQRMAAYEQAKQQTLGFIYFIQTELGMKNLGLADDELDGGLAFIPYNREGRRLKGKIRMNIDHIKQPYQYTLYRTGIAVGDYQVDHHHGQYPDQLPAIEFPPIPSFSLPLGCLIPGKTEGLVVCEKGISVTNIVNGTTRLQTVVMLTGQAAGVLAAKSIKDKSKVSDVSVRSVQEELLKAKCYLMPFMDVKPDDRHWAAIQRVGVTGILEGVGKPEGWANRMFFYPDSAINKNTFIKSLVAFAKPFSKLVLPDNDENKLLSVDEAFYCIERMTYVIDYYPANEFPPVMDELYNSLSKKMTWDQLNLADFDGKRNITRMELAVLLNAELDVFAQKFKAIDLFGKLKRE